MIIVIVNSNTIITSIRFNDKNNNNNEKSPKTLVARASLRASERANTSELVNVYICANELAPSTTCAREERKRKREYRASCESANSLARSLDELERTNERRARPKTSERS